MPAPSDDIQAVHMGRLASGNAIAAGRSEATVLVSLALVWTALWLLTVPVGDFPLNDDWVYALAVRSILETGRYALPSPATANVFAQAYWGALFCWPFGFSFTALRVSTFVLGTVGVLALYLFLRELGAERRLAVVGALTLAVDPLYLSLSTTFMTDVPFTALVTASLWLYVRGVRRSSPSAVVGAFVLAFAALLIRQFALMLPLAFGVAHVFRKGFGIRALAIAIIPILLGVALHVGYERWVLLTGRTPLVFSPTASLIPTNWVEFVQAVLHISVRILPYIGLLTTPLVVYLAAGRISGLRARIVVLGTLAIGALLLLLLWQREIMLPLIGNVLSPFGQGPLTLADTYIFVRNLPSAVPLLWTAATVWSAFATGFVLTVMGAPLLPLAAAAWKSRDLRPAWPHAMLVTAVVVYAGGLFIIGYQAFWFDRYLLLFLPPAFGLLSLAARGSVPRGFAAAAVALGLYAVFSVLSTHDYLAWNRARWRALADLQASGVSPQQIDGGYEFNGWYLYSPNYRPTAGKSYWWVVDNEYMIASGPMPGYQAVASVPWTRWLIPEQLTIYVLKRAL